MHVHELGFGALPKTYVFKGSKDVTKDQLLEQMSFFAKKPRPAVGVVAGARDGLSADSISRFLVPASECEFTINSVMFVDLEYVGVNFCVRTGATLDLVMPVECLWQWNEMNSDCVYFVLILRVCVCARIPLSIQLCNVCLVSLVVE